MAIASYIVITETLESCDCGKDNCKEEFHLSADACVVLGICEGVLAIGAHCPNIEKETADGITVMIDDDFGFRLIAYRLPDEAEDDDTVDSNF